MSINTNMFYLYKKTVKRTGIHIIVELIDMKCRLSYKKTSTLIKQLCF